MRVLEVDAPRGPARLRLDRPPRRTVGLAVAFHGAGGDTDSAVLVALRDQLVARGVAVARLDQPYVVAGRRAPDPAPRLDEVAALAVAAVRRERGLAAVPLTLAGKSSGARVGCRVAATLGAAGVAALGFPLHPPGRPEKSRRDELAGAAVPVLVVQGSRDTFGAPGELAPLPPHVTLHEVRGGDHSFAARKADGRTTAECVAEAAAVAAEWLAARVSSA